MKFIINAFAIFVIAITFAACQKANDPVSPNIVDKTSGAGSTGISAQGLAGDFQVTFKNYRNTNATVTIAGKLNFVFEKTTYSYSAQVSNSVDEPTSTFFHDRGTYSLDGNIIKLADDATKLMSMGWMPSLYLSGSYSYTRANGLTIIEGNGLFGTIKIVLKTPGA